MSSPESVSDVEAPLRQLIVRGFHFIHSRDVQGEILAVVGVRAHDDVIDVVHLHAEDNVIATRIPGDEANILAPTRVLWCSSGDAHDVLDDLLSLPDFPADDGPSPTPCPLSVDEAVAGVL